jgi:hypothetical protein
MIAVDLGIDARASAVDEACLATQGAATAVTDLSRGAHGSRIASEAVSRRPTMIAVDGWIHAGSAAVDEARLAGEAARAPVADLAGRACGSASAPRAIARSATIGVVAARIDARPVAVDESRLTRELADAEIADLSG